MGITDMFIPTSPEQKKKLNELCSLIEKQTVTPQENLDYAQRRLRALNMEDREMVDYFNEGDVPSTSSESAERLGYVSEIFTTA